MKGLKVVPFVLKFWRFCQTGKIQTCMPWGNSRLCIGVEYAGKGSMAEAQGVAVAVGFIGFGVSINTHSNIE